VSNVVSGRQLRTARVFARLSQAQFAKAIGIDEGSLKDCESKDDGAPELAAAVLEVIEDVLLQKGVVLSSSPTTGLRRPT